MPHPSRTARAARTVGGRFISSSAATTAAVPTPSYTTTNSARPINGNSSAYAASSDDDEREKTDFRGGRAAKRRKLEIRGSGPRQQTLDGFFNNRNNTTAPSQPPAKIAVARPNGPLIETINGIQKTLAINENEVLGGAASGQSSSMGPQTTHKSGKATGPKKQEDKRTLRSQHDGSRLKSELATYFPNYEEVIFETPREQDFINVDTTLYIAEEKQIKAETPSPNKSTKHVKGTPSTSRPGAVNGAKSQASPSTRSPYSAPTLDFSPFARTLPEVLEDPLSDDAFLKSHKRAERKEKQMRNIEREHAMHEKVQLDRLLDGLLSHDWLRVLGVTGVTEGEAKKFEPKRDYFIVEVRALVDKFKEWKEEEKRQRLEREAALAAEREAEDEADIHDDEEDEVQTEASSHEPPSSDLNASAARQLQQETVSAIRSSAAAKIKVKRPQPQTPVPPRPIPYRPPSPITTFYASRHLRDSAMKKARSSRNLTAFGHALPELEEHEFSLPPDYITEDVLRASARERRRRKREGVANASDT